ncbi:ABC transporter substrate-binding protein [Actinosynnema sp. NPDC047251]|uniref:Solute-binding protein family 5 domain-containing protein n=1 Tax=Saccharothrix espanaensis (strain ATCC 51144 / DSM 44229 / JCM 9112 / NBRC 15066 / NRRL 15764) TaxID=1179773 RepID=K0KBG1_SACES|nr:ABC transporter substrate-binding protein [Saccharothrix espanaensis]CCH33978.1 hypothetical protein BN6_67410 [Saccharothrix espanaensis DSM 44229]
MRLTLVAVVLLVLAGCGSGPAPADGKRAATDSEISELTWAMPGAPRSLDIAHAMDSRSNLAIYAAFDGLLELDGEGALKPKLATAWSNPDELTYEYTLRQGVKYWDGSTMTAEDVAYSLQRQLDPEQAAETAMMLGAVDSVAVTAPDKVTVKLKVADPAFKYVAALNWIVQPKAYQEAAGKDLGGPDKPGMGAGPYKVEKFSPADGVVFQRFDGYWGEKPKVGKLSYKPIPDPEALRLAMIAGEVDGTFGLPLQDARKWERTSGVNVYTTGSVSVNYLSLDVNTAPFDDLHVRKAIAHSVDRKGLLEPLFGGRGKVSVSPVSTLQLDSFLGKDESAKLTGSLPTYEFDLAKAKEELAKSAHPDGFSVEVPYSASQNWARLTLENLARNLSTIGITVTPKAMTDQQWVAQLYAAKDLKLQIMRAGGGTPYPGEMLPLMFGKKSIGPNGLNTAAFTTPEVEAKLAAMAADKGAIGDIMRTNADQLPYIPLFEEQLMHAVRSEAVFSPEPTPWLAGANWVAWLRATA